MGLAMVSACGRRIALESPGDDRAQPAVTLGHNPNAWHTHPAASLGCAPRATLDTVVTDILALLVEDDARLARFTAEFLEQNGVTVTLAPDGETGLREAAARSYDIVILDLQLPRRDGLGVCRELRARSAVPILVVTARSEEPDRIIGLELGADDYLGKPFSARELLARIRALIGDLARSFNRMAEQIQQLRLAERELLGDISHELRTPLARMRVVLDLASDADAERARR
jgi:DNA-binding response OmpR family regulator